MTRIFLLAFFIFSGVNTFAAEHITSEKNTFGQKLDWIKVDNTAGERRQVIYPLKHDDINEVKFGFAVKKLSGKKTMIAILNLKGIFDLRVTSESIYLDNKKLKKRILLSKTIVNKPLLFRFIIAPDKKIISSAYLNGQKIKGFKAQKWLSNRVGNKLTVFGATSSGIDFYFTKPVVSYNSKSDHAGITENKAPWRKRPVYEISEQKVAAGIFEAPWKTPVDVDITFNPERIAKIELPTTFYCTADEWKGLPALIKTDPLASKFWQVYRDYAVAAVKAGGLSFKVKDPQRYIYRLWGGLRVLGFVHMTSGNKEVGKLLKAIVLDTAKRPLEFWIHSSLRKYDKSYPIAALECASITLALATAYHWNRELFNAAEKRIILDALRYKGLYPCMRWLEKNKGHNNWLAVIAGGAIAGGRVLGEEQCVRYAGERLKYWTTLVEDDGSYSEPLSYFNYGASSFIRGALVLGSKESLELGEGTPLKGSLRYLAYNYVKARTPIYEKSCYKVNFADGDFPGPPDTTLCIYLANAFKQGLGYWLMKEYSSSESYYNLFVVMMKLMYNSNSITPKSPQQLKLPKVAYFDNGIGFIRSGWEGLSDTVLAIRSGGGGKTNYAHDHQNRNAIILFKYGEYMIAESGRTSYRSPMHFSWDMHTRSSNTITFWDDTQKTRSPAEMIMTAENEHIGYISSEASRTYRWSYKIEKVRRRVLYLKDLNSFVMWDDIISRKTMSTVNWRVFFNNFDRKTKVEKLSDETLIVKRNNVGLKVFAKASEPEGYSFGKGWLHTGYSYNPGDPREGKEGSSISWTCKNKGKKPFIAFYSYLGSPECQVKFDNGKMLIEKGKMKYTIEFLDDKMSVSKNIDGKTKSKLIIDDKAKKLTAIPTK